MTGRGWRLPFRPFGVPVELDPTFALILPLFAWLIGSQVAGFAELFAQLGVDLDPAPLSAGAAPWLLGASAAIGLFASVLVHELGHAVTARAYGVRTRRITLWFLGGVAQLDDIPRRRGAEAIVAIVGPITSGGLSLLLWGLLRSDLFAGGIAFVMAYLAVTNAGLAVFNLLPALPLDGGRVLRSLLAIPLGDARATRISGAVSRVVAIALGVYGFLSLQVFLLAIAFFIDAAGRAEVAASQARRAFEGRRVREAMTPDPVAVDLGWSLEQLRRLRAFRAHTAYPVLDADGAPIGWVRASDLDPGDDDTPVADLLRPVETVAADEDLETAVRRLAAADVGR
ncbi:MAG: site-2 protease family protein, partial [Trueperaceae bacterium]|nr:site-2 protease family protein [Trueperaceae bacterium]